MVKSFEKNTMQDFTAEELEVLCDLQIDDIFRDEDIPPIEGETQPDIVPVTVDIPQGEPDIPTTILGLPEPLLSPVESASSASSDSWSSTSTDTTSKRTKRRCIPCNLNFKHHYDFFEHHRKHVVMPVLKLKQLTQREIEFQEFMKKGRQQFLCARKKTYPNIVLKKPTVSATDGDGLKLKFKFHNVQMNHAEQDEGLNGLHDDFRRAMAERRGEKILKASEIKQSPPGSPSLENRRIRELIPIPELPNDLMGPPDRIHFECPTLDGLDQFNSDSSREDASDILKNLLELNQQPPMMEPEWNGQVPNEFISIEKLGHVCRVCHMNFTDPVLLYQHQRQTGHDIPQGPPMPPQNFQMSQHPAMPRMPTTMHYRPPDMGNFPGQRIRDLHPPPSHLRDGPNAQMAAMRLQQMRNGQFRPVMPVQTPYMRARHPPPLYRVTGPQGMPSNVPQMSMGNRQQLLQQQMVNGPQGPGYRFAVSNGIMMNGGSLVMDQNYNQQHPMMQDSAQLQPPMHGMPMFRAGRPSLPQRRHSVAPIGMRPNLPQFQPPLKKPRTEGMLDGPMITMPPRAEGVPVIESVQSGVQTAECSTSRSSPVPSGQKSPKAVASILANRGITVTQGDFPKPKDTLSSDKSPEAAAKDRLADETESVVQKLALNSSVSIISKKKTPLMTIDVSEEEMNAAKQTAASPSAESRSPKIEQPILPKVPPVKPRHTTFLSCPEVHCQKKFLTEEALQRHTQKGHHSNIRFKCTKCSVMFSSSESLIIHQRRVHRTVRMPGEDLGIPIVDLNNGQTRMKLLGMGIRNFIPLGNINKVSNGFFGLPLVCLKGAPNAAISNLQTIGADSVLSLGPIKPIVPK